ILYSTSHKTH
ncbi:hypothetical protein BVZ80_00324B, partial [Haemophilus influenzae]